MLEQKHNNQLATVAFWFIGLIWGSNFIFMKMASDYISSPQLVFIRVICGFAPIAVYAFYKKSLSLSHLKHSLHFIAMALLATVIYYYGFAKGTALLPSGIAGAISGAIPISSLIMAVLFLKEEKITLPKVAGTLVGFIGVVVLARPFGQGASASSLEGALYMIMGSLCVGASFVYAKRFLVPLDITPLALTTYQLGFAALIIALGTDFTGIEAILEDPASVIATSVGLGLLGTGAAYLCYYLIVAQLGASRASSVTYIPPVVALAIGAFIAKEHIEVRDYLATGLIILGVLILSKKSTAKPASHFPKATIGTPGK